MDWVFIGVISFPQNADNHWNKNVISGWPKFYSCKCTAENSFFAQYVLRTEFIVWLEVQWKVNFVLIYTEQYLFTFCFNLT